MIKIMMAMITISLCSYSDVYQRELDFVNGQIGSIQKQMGTIISQRTQKAEDLNRKIDELHLLKAKANAELESITTEVSDYQRLAKKSSQIQSTLYDRWDWLKNKNSELFYFSSRKKPLTNADFTESLKNHSELIVSISQIHTSEKSYTDPSDSLRMGTIFHLGPFASFLKNDNNWTILKLTRNGYYSETKESAFLFMTSDAPFATAAFIQNPFSKLQPILKERNFFNTFLDLLPAVFLSLVFFSIGWIFIQLAKN